MASCNKSRDQSGVTIFLSLILVLNAAILSLERPNEPVSRQRTFTVRFAVWHDGYACRPFL